MKDRNGKTLGTTEIFKKITNRIKTICLEFWLMILRFVGFIPLHFVRKLFYIISGVKMPWDSTIHIGACFFNPSNITIGHDTIIGDHCFMDGRAPLKIGSHVGIASQVLIYNDEHNINSNDYSNSFVDQQFGKSQSFKNFRLHRTARFYAIYGLFTLYENQEQNAI